MNRSCRIKRRDLGGGGRKNKQQQQELEERRCMSRESHINRWRLYKKKRKRSKNRNCRRTKKRLT